MILNVFHFPRSRVALTDPSLVSTYRPTSSLTALIMVVCWGVSSIWKRVNSSLKPPLAVLCVEKYNNEDY